VTKSRLESLLPPIDELISLLDSELKINPEWDLTQEIRKQIPF
jgi:hypothetical protein